MPFAARGGFNYLSAVSRSARTLTPVNQAQVSTAQSKFGGASALFDGNADYIDVTATDDMKFDTSDFTWEFWFRTINKPTSGNFRFPVLLTSDGPGAFSSGQGWVGMYDRHQSTGNSSFFTVWSPYYFFNLSGSGPLLRSTTTISNNTWYHVALVRDSGTFKLFMNGNMEDSRAATIDLEVSGGTAKSMRIGNGPTSNDNSYNGYIDELRVSDIARYSANFTPQTAAFSNDSNTLLLMHADGANGSTTFTDDVS
jgi:hypothetical protein